MKYTCVLSFTLNQYQLASHQRCRVNNAAGHCYELPLARIYCSSMYNFFFQIKTLQHSRKNIMFSIISNLSHVLSLLTSDVSAIDEFNNNFPDEQWLVLTAATNTTSYPPLFPIMCNSFLSTNWIAVIHCCGDKSDQFAEQGVILKMSCCIYSRDNADG
jgi:hypothetical protein